MLICNLVVQLLSPELDTLPLVLVDATSYHTHDYLGGYLDNNVHVIHLNVDNYNTKCPL